jgi:hypothetical protein
MSAVRGIQDDRARADALAYIAPVLPKDLHEVALALISDIKDEEARARALAGVAEHVPQELIDRAVQTAQAIGDVEARTWALAALAAHLPEVVVRETMERARQVPRSWRPASIVPLATRLATLGHAEEATAMVTQVVAENRPWANALTGLSTILIELPPPVLYPIWRDALRGLARAGRESLLSGLRGMTPVIRAVGGSNAVEATALAIQDVGRWWF